MVSLSEKGPMVPETGVRAFTTSTAQIWICPRGIFRISCLAGSVHDLAAANENMKVVPTESKEKRPVLADIRHVKAIDRQAREVYRSRDRYNLEISALAILVGSPLSRAIGNFFVGLSRMPMPTRLFIDERPAVEWLLAAHRGA